jgi:hypothetical protein
MGGGIPVEKHDNMVFFMEATPATRKSLGWRIRTLSMSFAGSEGIIRWKGQRCAKSETERELFETAETPI